MNKKERETREFETDFQKFFFFGGGGVGGGGRSYLSNVDNFLEARSENGYGF